MGKTKNKVTRFNFFVGLRADHPEHDLGLGTVMARANVLATFSSIFFSMQVRNTRECYDKIKGILDDLKDKRELPDAKIGNIIFDGHGHFESAKSRVTIGEDVFCAETFPKNDRRAEAARMLGQLMDAQTKVAFGHCFAGALYNGFRGAELLRGFSSCFRGTVYGCQSMTFSAPGMFTGGYALASFPKEFAYYGYENFRPVWMTVGDYVKSTAGQPAVSCNTISYNTVGEIEELPERFLDLSKPKKSLQEVLPKLMAGEHANFTKKRQEWVQGNKDCC